MMKPVLLLMLLVLALSVFVLVGCESPAAQRELAQAERIRAEAQAYERERAADAAAEANRASVRQMERDAAHQRSLETLPFVVAVGGGVLVLVLAVMGGLFALSRQQQPADNNHLALRGQEWGDLARILAERDRQIWHALAELARQQQQIGAGQYEEGRR